MCIPHYRRALLREKTGLCWYPQCGRPIRNKGYCKTHYEQLLSGQPLRSIGRYSQGPLDRRALHVCCTCKRSLPVTAFNKNKSVTRGYTYDCKECQRWERLLRRHSLTREEYQCLWDLQGCGCAVCGKTSCPKPFHIDHDHACCRGENSCGMCVRGICCQDCNARLLPGYELLPAELQDSPRLNAYLAGRPIGGIRQNGCERWPDDTVDQGQLALRGA